MWKKSSINILFLTPIVVLVIGGFNYIVDPYDIFDSPKIEGFNQGKPEIYAKQRIYKASRLIKQKHAVVIFGTSRTDRGINPDNSNLIKLAYNGSINNMTLIECECMLDAILADKTGNIIIGIDLFTFYAKSLMRDGFDKDIFESKFAMVKYFLSVDAARSSFATIVIGEPKFYYTNNGLLAPISLQKECNALGGHKKMFLQSEESYYKDGYSKSFDKFQVAHWQAFERILDKAHKNNANITFFISPSHARQWEVLAIAQSWDMFEEYRRRLVAVNEKVALLNKRPPFVLWDFAGYHPLTTEAVPDDPKAKMKYYWDSSHYKKELGDIVLDRIFDGNYSGGQEYPDFGVRLSRDNIDVHLAKIKVDRQKWRNNYPKDIAEIKALKVEKQK